MILYHMSKSLNERLREIDISGDSNMLQRHQRDLEENAALQKTLDETGEYLEQTIKHYASFNDVGEGEQIPVREYLERHPEILQEHGNREVRRYGKTWNENSRQSFDNERGFCAQARELYGGRFGEVFQSVFVGKEGQIRKYLAFSGKADGVDEEDIDKSIPSEDLESLKAESELVVLVHNHPDFYRDSKVFEKRDGPTIGFMSNGALSKKDIELADRFYHDKLGGKIPLLMVAVNEDGLTHSYVAGKSGSYEM